MRAKRATFLTAISGAIAVLEVGLKLLIFAFSALLCRQMSIAEYYQEFHVKFQISLHAYH